MQNNFSDSDDRCESARSSLPWCSVSVDWPCELVVAEVEIVGRKEPNVLQWALVRILDEFTDSPPSLDEATEELGITAPVFFRETLQTLLDDGALAANDPDQPMDLSNCRITPAGRALLKDKPMEGAVERHGLRVIFDAVTGEHLTPDKTSGASAPTYPVLGIEELPERVTHLGLDRARDLARAQQEPFVAGHDCLLRDVTVQCDQGRHIWMPVQLSLEIGRDGVLRPNLPGARADQLTWFEQCDLDIPAIQAVCLLSADVVGDAPDQAAWGFEDWWSGVRQLVSPFSVVPQVQRAIGAASHGLVIHAAWLGVAEIQESMAQAAERGVHCTVIEGSASSQEDGSAIDKNVDVIPAGGSTDTPVPVALIVDGFRALSMDRIGVRTPGGRAMELAVVSVAHTRRIEQLRQQMPHVAAA